MFSKTFSHALWTDPEILIWCFFNYYLLDNRELVPEFKWIFYQPQI